MYTLQAQYLARNPVHLSPFAAAAIMMLSLSGYALFRSVNAQKDRVRRSNGDCNIWGRKAEVMRCSFKTADGNNHDTLLLISGESTAFILLATNWEETVRMGANSIYRLVGPCSPRQLRRRSNAVMLHVCAMRHKRSPPLDLSHLHGMHSRPSLLPRRETLSH